MSGSSEEKSYDDFYNPAYRLLHTKFRVDLNDAGFPFKNAFLCSGGVSSMSPISKEEIVDMIVKAGLLEDFINWLRRKRVEWFSIRRLEDLDEKLIKEYANEKKLLDSRELTLEDIGDRIEEKYEPQEIRPSMPPRRTAKKASL